MCHTIIYFITEYLCQPLLFLCDDNDVHSQDAVDGIALC